MIFSNLKLLKFVYRGLLTGMPLLTYNPYNKNPFHAPMTVEKGSTYLNFKLDSKQTDYLTNYIHQYNNSLDIVPIKIKENENENYYLSINIYNCSSPIFNSNESITRCEINTYVKDQNNNLGTLIIDYLCNDLSMDPVNIFKKKSLTQFYKHDMYYIINCNSTKDNINLKINFTDFRDTIFNISDALIFYTDIIYYKNV